MPESSVILIVFFVVSFQKLHRCIRALLTSWVPRHRGVVGFSWVCGWNSSVGTTYELEGCAMEIGIVLKFVALLYMCPPVLQCEETCVWWVPSKSGPSARVLEYMKFLRFLWQTSMDIEICSKSPSFSTTFASPRASRLPALAERQEKTWMATRVKEPTLVGYKGLHPARSNAQKGWQNAGIS